MLNGHVRESFEQISRASGWINHLSVYIWKLWS